jgi:hypothetical protein
VLASHGLDHLHVEQLRQWHPAGLGRGAFDLAVLRLCPSYCVCFRESF